MSAEFRPILYLKSGCPYCFKARLFLLEAGLLDRFDVREFVPGEPLEARIREELAPHFDKLSFPTVRVAPGRYMNESEDIIAHYAAEHDIDALALPLLRTFSDVLLPHQLALQKEVRALKEQLDRDAGTAADGDRP